MYDTQFMGQKFTDFAGKTKLHIELVCITCTKTLHTLIQNEC